MNRVAKFVAVIVVGLLLPSAMYAAGSDDIEGAKALLGKAFQLPTSTNPRENQVDAALKEILKKQELTQKEQVWVDKVEAARKEMDIAKTAETLPGLIQDKLDKKRAAISREVEILSKQMNLPPSSLNQKDLKSEEDACPSVNTQYSAYGNMMASEGMKEIQAAAPKFASLSKEEKQRQALKGAALAKQFKADLVKEEEEEEQAAKEGNERNFKDSLVKQKDRIEGLKEREKELKSEKRRRQFALIDSIFGEGKLLDALAKDTKDTAEVQALASGVHKKMNDARVYTLSIGMQAIEDDVKACKKMVEKMGKNPLEPNTLLNAAYQTIVAKHDGDADFYANRTWWTVATQEMASLKCPDTSAELDAAIGDSSPIKQQMDTLPRNVKANELVQNVSNLLPQLQASFSSTGDILKRPIRACEKAAVKKKAIEAFITQGQNQNGQVAQDRLSGRRRGAGGPGGRRNNPGGAPGGGSSRGRNHASTGR